MSARLSTPILLGINVDHVATLRQARRTRYPDPTHAALIAETAGADSITVHLREDRRHIQESDLQHMQGVLTTRMNLEMAVADPIVEIACRLRPADACLVPERREELTTEGGLDVLGQAERISSVCARLTAHGIRVALFIDPDRAQIDAAQRLGVGVVELHTGRYADAADDRERGTELHRIADAATHAAAAGIEVHAGHGLNYHNVGPVAALPQVVELNIGHAVVARAITSGIAAAVADMRRLMQEARAR